MMRKPVRGFTLIELLVVIATLAILSAIAYPMYQDQVRKSRRGAAKGALLELSQFMERNYTETNRYDQDADGNAIALPFATSEHQGTVYYNIAVAVSGTNSFTLTATPTAVQSGDDCGTLTLDNVGNRTGGVANCW